MAIKELWVEKYRPKTIDEYVFKDEQQKSQIMEWITQQSIPNCIFSGSPGTGKSCLAQILINELQINNLDVLAINASRTNSVDDVRNKIVNFSQLIPFGDFNVVFLDECLDENTEVVTARNHSVQLVKIKDLNDSQDLVKSYNVNSQQFEWEKFSLFDKGYQETITIEFENNSIVTCTPDHKWYVEEDDKLRHLIIVKASELSKYSHVITTWMTHSLPAHTKKLKIRNITNNIDKSHVYDLSVDNNHNFFITENNILTHNCDFLSTAGQAALRGVMEAHHATTRFILTANYPNRIIPAIHSRCQGFHIEKLDLTEFTARAAQILITENIEFDLDTLDTFVKGTYPDLRKCINNIQLNSINKKLLIPESATNSSSDYRIKIVELFKTGKINQARKLICGTAQPEEMGEIYRWLYDNISLFGDEEKQNKAILIIKQALVDHAICADSEINIAACLIKLSYLN